MNALPVDIRYPFAASPAIGDGASAEIRPGLLWLRMPMDEGLSCINIWAVAESDGWSMVDTGLYSPRSVAAWRATVIGPLSRRPVKRIFVTHMHPDHAGMAGWLHERFGAALWMPRLEYLTLKVLSEDQRREPPLAVLEFYRRTGWDDEAIDHLRARFGEFGRMVSPLPDSFVRLKDFDHIQIGSWNWEIVVGAGHSPEHACLYCAEQKILISGDQILPRISSNVSVYPMEPEADPLTTWLRSLAHIAQRVTDDVLVLPSHGEPFYGLHARIDQLIQGHETGLIKLLEGLTKPKRAIDVFGLLFRREVGTTLYGAATGESLAHLHCLRTRGLVQRIRDATGVDWWIASAQWP